MRKGVDEPDNTPLPGAGRKADVGEGVRRPPSAFCVRNGEVAGAEEGGVCPAGLNGEEGVNPGRAAASWPGRLRPLNGERRPPVPAPAALAPVCCPREDRKGEGDVPRPEDGELNPVPAGVAGREKAEGRVGEERPEESPPV